MLYKNNYGLSLKVKNAQKISKLPYAMIVDEVVMVVVAVYYGSRCIIL